LKISEYTLEIFAVKLSTVLGSPYKDWSAKTKEDATFSYITMCYAIVHLHCALDIKCNAVKNKLTYFCNYEGFNVLTFVNTENHTCWLFLTTCSMWVSQKIYTHHKVCHPRCVCNKLGCVYTCLTQLYGGTDMYNLLHKDQLHISALFIGHLQVDNWKLKSLIKQLY